MSEINIESLPSIRYFKCPKCNQGRFDIEHLLNEPQKFGPWYCDNLKCNAEINGEVDLSTGKLILEVTERKNFPTYSLLQFKDLFVVVEHTTIGDVHGHIEHWDYFYHSHQCPTNLMHSAVEVFDHEESDPHGIFRFIASIPKNIENEKLLDQGMSTKSLLALFNTDGEPLFSHWPAENKGLIPWIAKMKMKWKEKNR